MKHEGKHTIISALTALKSEACEQCDCPPLSSLCPGQDGAGDFDPAILATPELNNYLRTTLEAFFPRSTPLSVLLLHISQLEHIHITPKSAILQTRHRYHAPASFLEQVLSNVRRTIRSSDQIIFHAGTGAAIILPDVDREGAFGIIERVYHSINLLQPETVIPPLKRETDIFLGIGSYPKPGTSLEELLYHTGCVAHRLTLRPSVITQLRAAKSTQNGETSDEHQSGEDRTEALLHTARSSGIPFMQLPTRLPQRLKHLISYQLACELRCAPVGRDHNRLTVAMAHPTDTQAIDLLKAVTSMVIYPVSCEASALDSLLANEW